jgi:hypothetical protein
MDRAHIAIYGELLIGFVTSFGAWYLFVFSLSGFGYGMYSEPSLFERVMPWVGPFASIAGLAWMFKLARPDPERGERTWRFRDF